MDANFRVFRATAARRTYLVVSTSAVRAGTYSPARPAWYADEDALGSLADEMAAAHRSAPGMPVPVTLRTHGFNTRTETFERELLIDSQPELAATLGGPSMARAAAPQESFRPHDRFLIGFRWPSEGLLNPNSVRDTLIATLLTPAIGLVLLLLPVLALLAHARHGWPGGIGAALRHAWTWLTAHDPTTLLQILMSPYGNLALAGALLGAGALFLILRLSTYERDRYRALHYGVPDLGEFMRRLEEELVARKVTVELDVVGHSMGGLVLVNAFRVMSDYFVPDDVELETIGRDGTFRLRLLVLCSPDLPAVMATPDRNNYFLSALRRFQAMHVFCSDRDLILKWLSLLANWTSEPRQDMAGRKLGNVFLARARPEYLTDRGLPAAAELTPMTRPIVRDFQLYERNPVTGPRRPAELHFHDCTLEPSLGGRVRVHLVVAAIVVSALAAIASTVGSVFAWLAALLGLAWGLGLVSALVWPRWRDHGWAGSIAGFFADSLALTLFMTWWVGWNPHSGYFMLGQPPRQRIAALLADPGTFPHTTPSGDPIDEEDARIRYRRVLVSV